MIAGIMPGMVRQPQAYAELGGKADNTETSYQVGEFYAPGFDGGLLYCDERFGLQWPLPVSEMSPKDAAWKPLSEIESDVRRRMSI
jgi:dTDP-4-dehydrorhamnose 3,5-epimerase